MGGREGPGGLRPQAAGRRGPCGPSAPGAEAWGCGQRWKCTTPQAAASARMAAAMARLVPKCNLHMQSFFLFRANPLESN